MEEPMDDRRKDHGHHRQERHAAVQGEEERKDFAARRLDLVHRAHAGQDHGGVQQSINQAESGDPVVAGDPNAQGEDDLLIALLPGSRHQEVASILARQLVVAKALAAHGVDAKRLKLGNVSTGSSRVQFIIESRVAPRSIKAPFPAAPQAPPAETPPPQAP